jgi:CubicO group peptidase (beta-lactamase class C family)
MLRTLRLIPFLAVLLLAPTAAAQEVDLAALDAWIAQAQRDWPVPGLSVAIVKDGEIVLEKGYGVRHATGGGPADEHTLYAIASNSKAFTAAALAQQVDAGLLSWDDRVIDHLPYFRLYDDYVTQEMRVRDLLSHRSGLGTFSGDLLWYGTPYTAEEVVRRVRHLPAAYPFRAGYGYSNVMFVAAGEVLRAVTGQGWHDYVEEHFFAPLGMDRSVTSVRDLAARDNVATPHKNERGQVLPIEWYVWDAMGAAGGIISSVHDMSQWMIAQLGGGEKDGVRLFSEGAQRTMWTVHNAFGLPGGYLEGPVASHFRGYGLGWSLRDQDGRLVVSHGGGYDGMYSGLTLVPEEDLGIVVLTNSMTGVSGAIVNRILAAYLGGPERDWSAEGLEGWKASRDEFHERQDRAEAGRIPGTQPSLPLDSYTGTYGGPMYGDAAVELVDGRLVLSILPNPDLVADLEHLHQDTWLIRWRTELAWFGTGTAQFLLDPAGRVTELKLSVPNDDLWFEELEMKRKDQG